MKERKQEVTKVALLVQITVNRLRVSIPLRTLSPATFIPVGFWSCYYYEPVFDIFQKVDFCLELYTEKVNLQNCITI